MYIWDGRSGAVICALKADENIVNSVAAHPSLPYLATSGIEDKVRIWGPHSAETRVPQDLFEQIRRNQAGFSHGTHPAIPSWLPDIARGACSITRNCQQQKAGKGIILCWVLSPATASHATGGVPVQESVQKGPRVRSLLFHPDIWQRVTGASPDLLRGLMEQGEIELELGGTPIGRVEGGCIIS